MAQNAPSPGTELERALAGIVAEARTQVAARREPNVTGLETRIAAAARRARSEGADAAVVAKAESAARSQLARIASVHRSRALVTREVVPPAPAVVPAARRGSPLRTKPTITGTLDVRRAPGEAFRLEWNADRAVTEWEVRFSERPDLRSDYVERETFTLAANETSIELPLGENPFRVNVVGRGRGRVQRRALISGLTRETWRDRWQRRATAS